MIIIINRLLHVFWYLLFVLEFVPDCYETHEMCDKAVNTYPSAIEFIHDQFKTQEMYDKAVDTRSFVFDSVYDRFITQELCDKVASENPLS